jgi:hypothetical protein
MRITAITFDSNEMPATITATMSLAEAAALAQLTGRLNADRAREAGVNQKHTSSVYDALVGSVMNRFFEDGTDEALTYKEQN